MEEEKKDLMLDDIANELSPELKKKRTIRIIIAVVILVVLVAITVTLILVLKKDDDEDPTDEPTSHEDPTPKDRTKILMSDSQFRKPKNTNKKYELIELEKSKYKFLLVEDPKTFNGGIEVRTGYGFNHELADGLAHYAEHIFFGGAETVSELELLNLVEQFGEFLNAYTWEDETVFQLFGSNYTYDTLLDYFSKIMQNEKYNRTYLQTEVDVVTSEYDSYNNSLNNYIDIYRNYSNPKHPFSKTKTGNTGNKKSLLETYGVEKLEEMLKNYYKLLFKPDNCIFLLYSAKPLEEMRLLAQKYFEFILPEPTPEYSEQMKKNIEALNEPLFEDNALGKIASYNSRRDTPKLFIVYHFSQKSGKIEMIDVLQFLFKKYEDNTLIKYLYDKKFISNFEINTESYVTNYELFTFGFDLTEEGFNNIDKVIEAFFAAVNTLRDDTNLQKLLDNMKSIDSSKFTNREEKEPVFPDDINTILRNYNLMGPEYILGAPYDLLYNENRIKEIIEGLSVHKSFIFVDSPKELNSKYLTSKDIIFSVNYNIPYKVNTLSEEHLNNLKNIKKVDEQEFKIRTENDLYTKLKDMTQKPCYELGNDYECKYNEYDPNKDKDYLPYTIKNETNILSLMKIDRSYGIPFIKGHIELILDENKMEEELKNPTNIVYCYLLLNSFEHKFSLSNLNEGGTTITISTELEPKITIDFTTYNDLLNNVIQYILDCFDNPIDEASFNIIKEKYILSNSINHEVNSFTEMREEIYKLTDRFLTADTIEQSAINKESVYNSLYNGFVEMFGKVKSYVTKLKYLTHGDISLEQATDTTGQLAKLIKSQQKMHFISTEKKIEIPEKSSYLYSYKSDNKYQVQGAAYTIYEYDESIKDEMTIYSNCARAFFWDYLRTKRGTGYQAKASLKVIRKKPHIDIFCLGKVYSPEVMDRFINEAILESFSFDKCSVKDIYKHINNKKNAPKFYAQAKFEELVSYLDGQKVNTPNQQKDEKEMTYESIVNTMKTVFIEKPKRVSILYHRGNINDDELKKQEEELDKKYFLNQEIDNDRTKDITYLAKLVNN